MNKKNLTQTKIEELNLEKVKVEQELQIWTEKNKKAEEYSEVLYETRSFTIDFWNYRINEARNQAKKNSSWSILNSFKDSSSISQNGISRNGLQR